MRAGAKRPGAEIRAIAPALAAAAILSCAGKGAGSGAPGANEARAAYRSILPSGAAAAKDHDPLKALGDLLAAFNEWAVANRVAIIAVAACLAAAGLALLAVRLVSRRKKRLAGTGLPKRSPLDAAIEARPTPADELFAAAMESSMAGDYSLAAVQAHRAALRALMDRKTLSDGINYTNKEAERAISAAGGPRAEWKLVARAAESVSFGGRSLERRDWEPLLVAVRALLAGKAS
jgi:hypothetical protein